MGRYRIVQEGCPQMNLKIPVWITYKCKKCKCIFQREKGDTDNDYVSYDEPDYVICPNCGRKIYVHPMILTVLALIGGSALLAGLICLPIILTR